MDHEVLRLAQSRLSSGEPIEAGLQARLDAGFAALRPPVVRLCGRFLRDDARAEEIAQEVLAEAWRKVPVFRFEGSFDAFVLQIARNKCRNDRRRISERLTDDGVLEPASEEAGALQLLRDEEQEEVLLAAIAELPQHEQDALYLRYGDGLSVDEVTERLALDTASGARGLLQSARRHLRSRLRLALEARGHGSSFFRTTTT